MSTKQYNVFIVYSRKSLDSITEILLDLNAGDVSYCKIIRDGEGRETNRTLVVADESVYKAAANEGLTSRSFNRDFTITRYKLTERNAPKEDQTYKLFIPYPKLRGINAEKQLDDMLQRLVDVNLLAKNSYRITVPLKSRQTGVVKGSIFVTFDSSVDKELIQLVKLIIDGAHWFSEDEDESEEVKCFWARKQLVTTKKKEKQDRQEKPVTTGPVVRKFIKGKAVDTVFSS
jgi:hypothetical protein